jgi:hypothetical protein
VTVIVSVLYVCETFCLALREDHRLQEFVSRVLKRVFGSKREEVTEGWRILNSGEPHNLYFSQSEIREG